MVPSEEKEDTPFSKEILEQELPRRFQQPQIGDYSGSTDLDDHMCRFEHMALLHQYADGVKCQIFLNTLVGPAQRWFQHLPPLSIRTFKDSKAAFLHQFVSCRKYQQTPLDLFTLKQKPKETLRAYLHRFDGTVLNMPPTPSDVLISALTQGLAEGDFFRSLVKKPPGSYQQLLDRANKYIHLEETQIARKTDGGPPPRPEKKSVSPSPRQEAPPKLLNYNNGRAVQTVDSAPLFTMEPGSTGAPPARFCTYHQTHRHGTDECRELAHEINRLVKERQRTRGAPFPAPQRSPTPNHRQRDYPSQRYPSSEATAPRRNRDRRRQPSPPRRSPRRDAPRNEENRQGRQQPQHHRERPPTPQGAPDNAAYRDNINMIFRGSTDGDSHRARRAHCRSLETYGVEVCKTGPLIHFGPQDLAGVSTPHDDALVIRATIGNYNVGRVFVDTGSSVNVLYKEAFAQMQIDRHELRPMSTALFRFSGHEVQPLGQINLPLSLGEEPLRRTRNVIFVVVDAPSSYNVILGRPALSAFQAVVSTFYQKIKFPVADQVGMVRGDQGTARGCYVDVVQAGRKRARIIRNEVQTLHETAPPKHACPREEVPIVPGKPE
ncbi:uncharacterized protein LOC141843999 [Curcuma longa]|uniref:uncharacterized protein LOC141843999 n=1 Tax=Curcuma longa TaxID=136217 RepID=UPI003D9E3D8C